MLVAAERLLRELPSSVTRVETETSGAVRPPIAWSQTYVSRVRNRRGLTFVCDPASSVRHCARPVPEAGSHTGFAPRRACRARGAGPAGVAVASISRRSTRLLRHAKLEDVRLPRTVSASTTRLAGASLREQPCGLSRSSTPMRSSIRRRMPCARSSHLSSSPPARRTVCSSLRRLRAPVDGLVDIGFEQVGFRLIPGKKAPFARLLRTDLELEIWWQTPIWRFFPELQDTSAYRDVLERAGLS